jgi:uncharacterized membrane protein YdfJ with MMPL/SSD domain
MAPHLYRLGRWSFQHRRKVLGAWLATLVAVFALSAAFSGQENNSFVVPGTESQDAQDLLDQKFPGTSGATARIVFAAPEGEKLTSTQNELAVRHVLANAEGSKDVTNVIDPYQAGTISKDGRIAYADVVYPVPSGEIDEQARDELGETGKPAEEAGLTVEYGGGLVSDTEEANSEGIGMIVAYVVLAITLASLLAAGMPLLNAIIGVLIGVTGLHALSGLIDVSETAPILATMLGLAVGIDYALFILSRYRENLDKGMAGTEAAAQATATAGSAVVFAGTTVIIALVGLTVVNIPFLTVMGLAAAGTVAIAVLIALTLMPALLGFAGHRIARRNRFLSRRRERTGPTMSTRWAQLVTRRPLAVLAVGLTILGLIAVPAMHMKLGLPDGGSQPTSTTERRAYDLLTEGFGPGFNATLNVVVDAPGLEPEEQKQVAAAVASGLEEFPGVAAVTPPLQNEAGDVTIVSVTPTTAPASDETKELVEHLRDKADEVQAESGIEAYVTGQTALNIDTADRLGAALPKYIAVVVGLALVLLMMVFRSVLVPIKAAVGFLVSIGASLGLVVWVFQDGNLADLFSVSNPAPIVSFLPILLIGILFGLAMDYEVFLVSRVRESYVRTGDAKQAIIDGYGQSGRVVTAAGLIMIAVFGAFLLSPDPITKSIGLSLAFGVLVDAFIVRLTLVPAVMALLGRRAWWLPRRLGRVMPDLDIEGEKVSGAAAASS